MHRPVHGTDTAAEEARHCRDGSTNECTGQLANRDTWLNTQACTGSETLERPRTCVFRGFSEALGLNLLVNGL